MDFDFVNIPEMYCCRVESRS